MLDQTEETHRHSTAGEHQRKLACKQTAAGIGNASARPYGKLQQIRKRCKKMSEDDTQSGQDDFGGHKAFKKPRISQRRR